MSRQFGNVALLALCLPCAAAVSDLALTGDWEIRVVLPEPKAEAVLRIAPPQIVEVRAEKYDALPIYNPNGGGWNNGARLRSIAGQETTTPYLLDAASVIFRAGASDDAEIFRPHEDYEVEPSWGTFGRTANGRIGEGRPVFASYRYTTQRLDSIVLTADGRIELRPGEPRIASAAAPELRPGERRLASIWLPGPLAKLTPDHLFPILETEYAEPPKPSPSVAETLLPKAMAKLRAGEKVRVLAWGDSVTDGAYLPDPAKNRWQEQFAARLRERFPKATIDLITEAWGGQNTASYLNQPPGALHNFHEKVLNAKPDVIISEFVNDANLDTAGVEDRYGKILAAFRGIGAEWIILTPHYVRPDWMGLTRERDIDNDPRPYVAGLREFTARHQLALADAAKRYGRLWRQGLPYSVLMSNSINHPDPRGQKIFADALMELFP